MLKGRVGLALKFSTTAGVTLTTTRKSILCIVIQMVMMVVSKSNKKSYIVSCRNVEYDLILFLLCYVLEIRTC